MSKYTTNEEESQCLPNRLGLTRPGEIAEAEFEGIFFLESYFVGSNVRKPTQEGYADYVPVHLSET